MKVDRWPPHIHSILFQFWQGHDSFTQRNDVFEQRSVPSTVTFHMYARRSHVYVWQFVVMFFFFSVPLPLVSFNRISVGFIIIFVRRHSIAFDSYVLSNRKIANVLRKLDAQHAQWRKNPFDYIFVAANLRVYSVRSFVVDSVWSCLCTRMRNECCDHFYVSTVDSELARSLPTAAVDVTPLFVYHIFFFAFDVCSVHSTMISFGNKKSIYPKWNFVLEGIQHVGRKRDETRDMIQVKQHIDGHEQKHRLIQFKNDACRMLCLCVRACVWRAFHRNVRNFVPPHRTDLLYFMFWYSGSDQELWWMVNTIISGSRSILSIFLHLVIRSPLWCDAEAVA